MIKAFLNWVAQSIDESFEILAQLPEAALRDLLSVR